MFDTIASHFTRNGDTAERVVLKIDVDTNGGVVTLNGVVENEAARQRAEKIAGAIKGVKEVRNHLTVKRG